MIPCTSRLIWGDWPPEMCFCGNTSPPLKFSTLGRNCFSILATPFHFFSALFMFPSARSVPARLRCSTGAQHMKTRETWMLFSVLTHALGRGGQRWAGISKCLLKGGKKKLKLIKVKLGGCQGNESKTQERYCTSS